MRLVPQDDAAIVAPKSATPKKLIPLPGRTVAESTFEWTPKT
jgi:hypothetical protein